MVEELFYKDAPILKTAEYFLSQAGQSTGLLIQMMKYKNEEVAKSNILQHPRFFKQKSQQLLQYITNSALQLDNIAVWLDATASSLKLITPAGLALDFQKSFRWQNCRKLRQWQFQHH